VGRPRRWQGGPLRQRAGQRQGARVQPGNLERPGGHRGPDRPGRAARRPGPGDRPARLHRAARPGRGRAAGGPGGLRARPGHAADLYPGEAKTARRNAYIIADTARTRRKQVHWLDASSDKLLAQLRVLNGFHTDLTEDQTRVTDRLRDALTSIASALERALGRRLQDAGTRDLVAAFPTLTALRAADLDAVRASIAHRSPQIADKTADAVPRALGAQDVMMPSEKATGRVIAALAAELDRVFQRRDALAQEIEAVFLVHPFGEVLVSLPGIGPRTGARILAEIGDGG